jgi:hypothetical protein
MRSPRPAMGQRNLCALARDPSTCLSRHSTGKWATAVAELAGVGNGPHLRDMVSRGAMLQPITGGWVSELADGGEVARITGPAAKRVHCATTPATT